MNTNEEIRNDFLVTTKRKKLWDKQIQMLFYFDDFCQKHNLKYFVTDGTLLGAVRHKGFIPWDDDIDVAMLREDYDKLHALSNEFNKGKLFLQSSYTDNLIRNHIQIRDSSTSCLLTCDYKVKYNCGVFIDVFPLDKIPSTSEEIKSFFDIIKKYYNSIKNPQKKPGFNKNQFIVSIYNLIIYSIINFFYKLKILLRGGKKKCFKKFEKLCSKYEDLDTNDITYVSYNAICSKYDVKLYLKDYSDIIELPFEDIKVKCPIGYDSVLKRIYGNYNEFKIGTGEHGSMYVDLDKPYTDFKKITRKQFIHLFTEQK